MGARRGAVLVGVALAGAALLPAGAAAPSLPARDALGSLTALPGVAHAGTDQGAISTRTVGDALGSVRRHADAGAWLHALAAAHEAAGGPSAEGGAPLVAVAEPGEASFAAAGPGGDLDGNGTSDVLSLQGDDDGFTLTARRGLDGAPLWVSDLQDGLGALAFPLGEDLTGDGADDLAFHVVNAAIQVLHEERDDGHRYRYSAVVQHTVGVVDGRTGRVAWQHVHHGTDEETSQLSTGAAGATYDYAYTRNADGADLLLLVSDDLTGDGLPDVVVNQLEQTVDERWSGADAQVAVVGRGSATARGGVVASVHRGTDGALRARQARDGQAGLPLLLPAGSVAGAPTADLLWTTDAAGDYAVACVGLPVAGRCADDPTEPAPAAAAVRIELVEGEELTPLWSTTQAASHVFAVPLGADADGDGAADVGAYLLDEQGERLAILSGADGSALWAISGSEAPFLVATEPTDGGTVLLLGTAQVGASSPDAPRGLTVEATVERRAGATGELLRSTGRRAHVPSTASSSSAGWVIAFDALPDADGDGRRDLLVSVGAQLDDEARSVTGVEDLVSGTSWRERASDDLRVDVGTDDLDGDGLTDLTSLALAVRPADGGAPGVAVDVDALAYRPVDERALWRFTGSLFDLPLAGGQQDRDPGQELVDVVLTDAGWQVRSLHGADLTPRWTAPSRG